MAEISSGKDEQNVEKAGSFNLFGRSPARSLSKKKSNPLGRMFSLTRKKSEKRNVADAENDISSTNEDDVGKQGEIDIQKTARETISEVTEQVDPHANVETVAQQTTMSANPDVESKESAPAMPEKKAELFGKLLLEKVEKTKEEVMEKAEETKEQLLKKGDESLQEGFRALTHIISEQAPAAKQQPTNDESNDSNNNNNNNNNNNTQEKSSVDDDDEVPNMVAQRLQEEVVGIVGVMQEQKEETTFQERSQETSSLLLLLQHKNDEVAPPTQEDNHEQENVNQQEENCVSSLAEGLQKICSTWNNKKQDD